jgi:hypothetical protein
VEEGRGYVVGDGAVAHNDPSDAYGGVSRPFPFLGSREQWNVKPG